MFLKGFVAPEGMEKCNSIICFKLDEEEIKSIGEIPIEVIINIGNQLNHVQTV